MYVYAVFHLRGPNEVPEFCNVYCTQDQAKHACETHEYKAGVSLGVMRVPLIGFPWFTVALMVVGLVVFALIY